jgi:hypothetical protein
MEEFET